MICPYLFENNKVFLKDIDIAILIWMYIFEILDKYKNK